MRVQVTGHPDGGRWSIVLLAYLHYFEKYTTRNQKEKELPITNGPLTGFSASIIYITYKVRGFGFGGSAHFKVRLGFRFGSSIMGFLAAYSICTYVEQQENYV